MQCTLCVVLALGVSLASGSGLHGSAVTKVVKMLKDLESSLEKEQEKAQDLHDKFVCNGKTTVESKGKAIDDANARIAYLETYVADIGSGKVSFTMNEKEMFKELDALKASIQNDTAVRDAAHAHFEEQQKDTTEAIEGLAAAVDTLAAGTADAKVQGLVQLRGAAQSGARLGVRARIQKAKRLQKALELGDQYLSSANDKFLHVLLTGKSMQAHTSGKVSGSSSGASVMSAQARLGDVIETLQGIAETFKNDVEKSNTLDLQEFQSYMRRHQAQEEQKDALKASLAKLEKEYAARAQAKEQSEAEISSLKEQVATDTTIKDDTDAAVAKRNTEWDERVLCSQGEIEALGQAIETLTSDEARDLFRSSAASFVQVSSDVSHASDVSQASAARAAGQVLRSAGKAAKDHRLLILATQLSSLRQAGSKTQNPTFDNVFKSIDDMVAAIKGEEQSDLTKKESCEESLASNTAEKKRLERMIEDEESTMSAATGKISELSSRLEKLSVRAAEADAEIKSADDLRDAEAAAFKQAKMEDENAIQLIEQATSFITKAYSDGETSKEQSLLQIKIKSSTCTAGAQSSGIVETMKMVADDIRKEIQVAEKDETEAKAAYEKNKAELLSEQGEIKTARGEFQAVRSTKSSDLASSTESKATITGQLESLVATMAEVKPGCDFYIKNFEARSKNRQTELDGLKQAKGILKAS